MLSLQLLLGDRVAVLSRMSWSSPENGSLAFKRRDKDGSFFARVNEKMNSSRIKSLGFFCLQEEIVLK